MHVLILVLSASDERDNEVMCVEKEECTCYDLYSAPDERIKQPKVQCPSRGCADWWVIRLVSHLIGESFDWWVMRLVSHSIGESSFVVSLNAYWTPRMLSSYPPEWWAIRWSFSHETLRREKIDSKRWSSLSNGTANSCTHARTCTRTRISLLCH